CACRTCDNNFPHMISPVTELMSASALMSQDGGDRIAAMRHKPSFDDSQAMKCASGDSVNGQ
ncbi:MAG: hypothetical protein VXX79_17415, partial [Pseudomonadota bacterium]|nr:hypothetical protein [Pseudomonadota bacterium]